MTGGRTQLDVLEDAASVADRVAGIVGRQLARQPATVLGLATGGTFGPVYDRLVALSRAGRASFSRATTFALDEYVGLGPAEPASFRAYLHRHLLGLVDIHPSRTHGLDGSVSDAAREAARYEATIAAAGGIDLQLLGLGRNGHIAFNEPGSAFDSRTREVALAPGTRQANAGAFGPELAVPERALTMGIGTILEARRILLVVTGGSKRAALAAALGGPITPDCPASALRLHPEVLIVADRAAAGDRAAAA